MADPRTWSAYANVPIDPEVVSFQRLRETERDDTNVNIHYVRTRYILTLKWSGVDKNTMLWHTQNFDPRFHAEQLAADSGAWTRVDDTSATANDTSLIIDNFASSAPVIRRNWHFVLNTSDGTLYTVSADATGAGSQVTVGLSPILQVNTDDDTRVFWLRVTDSRGEHQAGGMYNIIQQEEAVTEWATVNQAIDADISP